ncbi:POC1 centriolar protein A [Entophlyctis luteolus]|nr:POC1 centriolar protein A [Entophlyctis luteolus]
MQDPSLDRTFRGHRDVITDLAFKPSMTQLASGSMDCSVMVWNFKPGMRAFRFVGHKIWSVHRTKFQSTLAGHTNWVRSANFSPDSKLVVSGSDDKSVKLWDITSRECVQTYCDHTGTAFHPGGTVIATSSTDKSIKLFDIRMHRLIQHYHDAHVGAGVAVDTKGGEAAWVGGGPNSVAFGGPGGEWLISTGMDGVVKIWDLKEGHLFYTLHGHKHGPTTAAVFSPEGAFFATGGSDAQIMVWKSNFDSGVALNSDGGDGKPKSVFAMHQPQSNSNSDGPASFFSRKMASMNSNLVTTFPGSVPSNSKSDTGRKSPVNAKTNNSQANVRGVDGLAGMNKVSAEEPEIISVGEPVLNTDKTKSASQNDNDGGGDSYTSKLGVRTIPDELAASLQHIVTQIDVLTQTMSILETRLTANEDRVTQIASMVSESLGARSAMPSKRTVPVTAQSSFLGEGFSSSGFRGAGSGSQSGSSFLRKTSPDASTSGGLPPSARFEAGGGLGAKNVGLQTQRGGIRTGIQPHAASYDSRPAGAIEESDGVQNMPNLGIGVLLFWGQKSTVQKSCVGREAAAHVGSQRLQRGCNTRQRYKRLPHCRVAEQCGAQRNEKPRSSAEGRTHNLAQKCDGGMA